VIAYICTIDVPSVDEVTAKITSHGGTTALPKMAVPQDGWLAYGKDSEGNIFGVLQSDPSAALRTNNHPFFALPQSLILLAKGVPLSP